MSDLSLENALSLFASALTKNGKSSNTIVAYKGDLNQLITFLKKQNQDSNIETVTEVSIEAFKKDLTQNEYTAKSISRKLNSIKNFFSFLKNEGIIANDPSLEVKHPKYENDLPKILKPI